jgi:hypothetical protein
MAFYALKKKKKNLAWRSFQLTEPIERKYNIKKIKVE